MFQHTESCQNFCIPSLFQFLLTCSYLNDISFHRMSYLVARSVPKLQCSACGTFFHSSSPGEPAVLHMKQTHRLFSDSPFSIYRLCFYTYCMLHTENKFCAYVNIFFSVTTYQPDLTFSLKIRTFLFIILKNLCAIPFFIHVQIYIVF